MTYPTEPNPYGNAGQPGFSGQPGFQGQPPVEQKNTLGLLAVIFAGLFNICGIGLILGIVAVVTAKDNAKQKKFGWIAIGVAVAWGLFFAILSLSGVLDFSGSVSTTAP
ncbi:hypothetical protein [Segniliparus rugosus]|uniref:DUF4190 domain-containing protein n=1 Tax=Segniliparus rugosus (strain ATCC BAA-974 / DSM 45345 / CCUG 50838 / CIP 108380 / JCM 13579 / CDC 945) TaxID=679197 RepID=E5XST7_SEGRC|nr:hypothetical protein [Segniliparus rugosus]EFV12614.1 hypothetical protein HMPREF9336_02559 [Segniliparus rugosus ATCC BAA-974]